jgi:hypothetical protein
VRGLGRLSQVPDLLLLVPALILVLAWLEKDDDLRGRPEIGFFIVIVLSFMLLGGERIGKSNDRDEIWLLADGLTASIVSI